MTRARAWSWAKLAAKFLFAFGILFWMVSQGKLDLAAVRQGFSRPDFLVAAFGLILTALCLSLYRWKLLLSGLGVELTLGQAIRYGMIGAFFNTTMPGAVSGDLIKAWYVIGDRRGQRKTPILASILLDRVMGVFGLVIVAASPLVFFGEQVWGVPALRHLAVSVLGLFGGVLLFYSYLVLAVWGPLASMRKRMARLEQYRLGKVFLQAYDALLSYRQRPGILLVSLLISIANHLCLTSVVIFSARAIGDSGMSLTQYFLLVPIGLLTTAVPIAPAGLGVGHAAFHALFSLVGSARGPDVFTMLVSIQIFFNLLGVLFYLKSPKFEPGAASQGF